MNEIYLAVGRPTYELCSERYSRLQQTFELYDLKISAFIEWLLRHRSTAFVQHLCYLRRPNGLPAALQLL